MDRTQTMEALIAQLELWRDELASIEDKLEEVGAIRRFFVRRHLRRVRADWQDLRRRVHRAQVVSLREWESGEYDLRRALARFRRSGHDLLEAVAV